MVAEQPKRQRLARTFGDLALEMQDRKGGDETRR
jgi:hypothetical protein